VKESNKTRVEVLYCNV